MAKLEELLNNEDPVQALDPAYQQLLGDLQSNILSSTGKYGAMYFFLRFRDVIRAKYLIGMLARKPLERQIVVRALTSSEIREQLSEAVAAELSSTSPSLDSLRQVALLSEYDTRAGRGGSARGRHADADKDLLVTVMLTAAGYSALKKDPPQGAAFQQGMAERQLGDEKGQERYRNIHALVVVGFDPSRRAQPAIDAIASFLATHADIVARDEGVALRAKAASRGKGGRSRHQAIEVFGFPDGGSQPIFYAHDLDDRERQHERRRHGQSRRRGRLHFGNGVDLLKRDLFAPLRLVLCRDPHGRSPHACGTYFVFRKLQQDVEAFYKQTQRLARAVGRKPEEIEEELVGIKRDGTPLERDSDGAICPFHAHVRKANPIGDVPRARDSRIVRRGLPYGRDIERDRSGRPVLDEDCKVRPLGSDHGSADSTGPNERGLLFFCAQTSIEDQFERIQRWANDPKFRWMAGADPIIGTNKDNRISLIRKTSRGEPRVTAVEHEWKPVVSFVGGEYFFAPSISFLKGLVDELWL